MAPSLQRWPIKMKGKGENYSIWNLTPQLPHLRFHFLDTGTAVFMKLLCKKKHWDVAIFNSTQRYWGKGAHKLLFFKQEMKHIELHLVS